MIRLLYALLITTAITLQQDDPPSPTPTASSSPTATVTTSPTPTASPSPTATVTASPTATPSPTATLTPTSTATASPAVLTVPPSMTPTVTASWTPVVVTVPPVVMTSPPQVIVLTQPPPPTAVPPTVVPPTRVPPTAPPVQAGGSGPPPTQQTPFYGWDRFQSINLIGVTGTWAIQTDYTASANQFRRSSHAGAIARFPFTGDGLRLRYGRHELACAFDVIIDDELVETINAYQDEKGWGTAGPYFLEPGYHVLDIRSRADTSNVCGVDIDYLEVFTGPPAPAGSAAADDAPTVAPPQDVARVVLLSAPPTNAPTATPLPSSVITLSVTVSYDANASGTADIDEGVAGISVRAVSAVTGDLLASGFTDARGGLRLQVVTRDPAVAHIPLLGESLPLRPDPGATTTETWAVLLPPANHPAVIP